MLSLNIEVETITPSKINLLSKEVVIDIGLSLDGKVLKETIEFNVPIEEFGLENIVSLIELVV